MLTPARKTGILLVVFATAAATDADIQWSAPSTGSWYDDANWDGGQAPGLFDDVIINASGAPYQVMIGDNLPAAQYNSMLIDSADVEVRVDGDTAKVATANDRLLDIQRGHFNVVRARSANLGRINVGASGQFTLGSLFLDERARIGDLINHGAASIEANLTVQGDIENHGTLNMADLHYQIAAGGSQTIVNHGTINWTDVSGVQRTVTNHGTIRTSGVVTLDNTTHTFDNFGIIDQWDGAIGVFETAQHNAGAFSQLETGQLFVELGADGKIDRLDAALLANLDGTVDLRLIDGFVPEIGESFVFLEAQGILGTFTNSFVVDQGTGVRFDIEYTATHVAFVTTEVPGPGALILLLGGGLCAGLRRRRLPVGSRLA